MKNIDIKYHKDPVKEMKTLITKVFQWGIDRDLYKNSTVATQLVKLTEEYFEYKEAVTRLEDLQQETPEFIKKRDDAMGDMLIVIINMFGVKQYQETGKELTADELTENFYAYFDKYRSDSIWRGLDDISIEIKVKYAIRNIIREQSDIEFVFKSFVLAYGEEAYQVLLTAYEEIKDRKGKLNVYGNFVKGDDDDAA